MSKEAPGKTEYKNTTKISKIEDCIKIENVIH
jgi:hypothetical protein